MLVLSREVYIPDAVLAVDKMNTDVLNLSRDAVESQNTISLAC